MINELEIKYPGSSFINDTRSFLSKGSFKFPFNKDIQWQYKDLVKEIVPLLKVNNSLKEDINAHCYKQKTGFEISQINDVRSIALDYFNQGLGYDDIQKSLSQNSRDKVEIFRMLFKIHFETPCKSKGFFTEKDIYQSLVNGTVKFYHCLGDRHYLGQLIEHPDTYLKDISLNELFSTTPSNDFSKFKLSDNDLKFILEKFNIFSNNGWDFNHIDKQYKTFFYYSIKLNNLTASKKLIGSGALLDADPFGWDALDYLISNLEKYKHPVNWLLMFKNEKWTIRNSHLKHLEKLRLHSPEKATLVDKILLSDS